MKTKFRWYYVPEKLMVYPDTDSNYKMRIDESGNILGSFEYRADSDYLNCTDIIGPMWWTGFSVDENDLYKGDILKIKEIIHRGEGVYDDGIYLIDFIDGQFVAKHTKSAEISNVWYCLNSYECEIIGNEIEHKHLLESA